MLYHVACFFYVLDLCSLLDLLNDLVELDDTAFLTSSSCHFSRHHRLREVDENAKLKKMCDVATLLNPGLLFSISLYLCA